MSVSVLKLGFLHMDKDRKKCQKKRDNAEEFR